jgi:phage-related protein
MALNLDAILKISAQVVGEEGIQNLSTTLRGVGAAAEDAKRSFQNVVNSAAFQAAAVAAAAVGTALALSVREAIKFESAMAEVRKVVDGLDTPEGMKAIRQEIFELSRQIPITAEGFAEMYAAAGQAGIPRAELKAFATDVSKVAVAFDMTAGEAGDAMAKLRTNLGMTQAELMDLADAANHLSNGMATSAGEIVNFMLRSGSAGKQAGLSAEQTAAFGAAMMSSGAAAEVASTSFNNMIKALSRGDSMTERQVGALVKLGYANKDAAGAEERLTAAVEAESRKRVAAIEAESRQAVSEIQRRYRDIATLQGDYFDDDEREWSRNQEDRYDITTKGLQRERQAEIDASNKRAEALGTDNKLEIQAIEDKYDQRLKALRRQQEDEQVAYQRDARDRQQQVSDDLKDQEDMEVRAVEQKFTELKRIEELRKKEAIANAKETAKAMVGELGPNMASMLQKDAVGTIRDVFSRIKALPAEMQLSVISDLFGDEARALLPLINNSALLDTALGLVADKSKYAGSTAKEFAARIQTTEAKLQLAKNRLTEIAIVLGESFLPAIQKVVEFFAPLAEGLSNLLTKFPALGIVLGVVGTAFVALVALAPVLASFIVIAQGLAGLGIGATIAGWAGAIGPAVAGIGTALAGLLSSFGTFLAANIAPAFAAIWGTAKFAIMDFINSGFARQIAFVLGQIAGTVVRFFAVTLLPALGQALSTVVAFLSGPVGWALLAAGLIAALIAFREPIGTFFVWVGEAITGWIASLGQWLEPVQAWWSQLWAEVKAIATPFFEWLVSVWNTYLVTPISQAVAAVGAFFAGLWESITAAASVFFTWFGEALYTLFVEPWVTIGTMIVEAAVSLWEQVRGPVSSFFTWFGETLYTLFVAPWVAIGTFIAEAAVSAWTSVRDAVSVFFQWFVDVVRTYLYEPSVAALILVRDFFVDAFTAIKDFVLGWFDWWAGILYQALVEPWVKANEWIPKAAALVWGAVTDIIGNFFTWLVAGIKTNVVDPFVSAVQQIAEWFGNVFDSVVKIVGNFMTYWVKVIDDNLVKPVSNALSGLPKFFSDAFVAVAGVLREWFAWWGGFVNDAFVKPISNALTSLGELFSSAWASILINLSKAFGSIRSAWDSVTRAMASLWSSFIDAIQRAWSGVSTAFAQNVVTPLASAWQGFTGKLAEWFTIGVSGVSAAMGSIATAFNSNVVQPVSRLWADLIRSLGDAMRAIGTTFGQIWGGITTTLGDAFRAIANAFRTYVSDPLKAAWTAISTATSETMTRAAETVRKAYETIAGAIVGAFRGIVGSVGKVINTVISAINTLIRGVNSVRGAVGLSAFNEVPYVSIPTFAEGGFVKQATLAVVGEGGEPEYIVPASKMQAAAQNYLQGMRGERVLDSRPRIEVGQRPAVAAGAAPSVNVSPSFSVGNGNTSVSITTGPVQQIGGDRYVTLDDLQKAVGAASRQARDAVMRDLAQPGVRQRLGMA